MKKSIVSMFVLKTVHILKCKDSGFSTTRWCFAYEKFTDMNKTF